MLNKITKLVCAGAIIGVNGLCAWGNRIDVKQKDGPIQVIEGIDDIELPEGLSNPNNDDLWDEYDSYVDYIGIKLNFPEEIIQRCEDECWRIRDENKIRELEEIVSTEENFHIWCNKQEAKYPYGIHRIYAYILKKANEKNYLILWDFCSKMDIGAIIATIYYKGATHCMKGLYPHTPGGKYLKNFGFGA